MSGEAKDMVYENGDHFVTCYGPGKYKVFRIVSTHAEKVATIDMPRQQMAGLDRAIEECKRRSAGVMGRPGPKTKSEK